MSSVAQLEKQKGNDAFKAHNYDAALQHYTDAMTMDPSDPVYVLNRCMTNIKLERWSDAESDATAALEMDSGNAKAFYRRSVSRTKQGDFSGARLDIQAYADAGGEMKTVVEMNTVNSAAEAAAVLQSDDHSTRYIVADAGTKGLGAFATRAFQRGDLILAERPLYTVRNRIGSGSSSPRDVEAAVSSLSPAARAAFMALAHTGERSAVAIHAANAFSASDNASILCPRAARFNHSCAPNARYSWHAGSGAFRIYALRAVAAGDELLVSYISARGVYGSARGERQARLRAWGFECACDACARTGEALRASDARRRTIARLWESVPHYGPRESAGRIAAIVRGVRMMREEGYAADEDDFTQDAAVMCAHHSDWAAARYWGRKTYEARAAEFGGDSQLRALDPQTQMFLLNPEAHEMAGLGRREVLSARL
ncbi:SET domain-containing protein [Artomyces pyxidatus]|uniref:SET domain-containing protein n=1 Tax=Artomyces pyxidatus TaxID=48021 RepID=A0ACB8SPF3_9AGAM|nr:SET domain-containing protein [Artomyces pyxidatus]